MYLYLDDRNPIFVLGFITTGLASFSYIVLRFLLIICIPIVRINVALQLLDIGVCMEREPGNTRHYQMFEAIASSNGQTNSI